MLSHPTLEKNTYSFCMLQNHLGFPLEVYVPCEGSCRFCRAQRPLLAMRTRSLLTSWDGPFTTDFWFIVLGTSAKKITLMCCIWKFAACQRAFPYSFWRYTSNLLRQIYRRCQHHRATQHPSRSASLISCLRKAFLKLYVVFPFLCMKPQLLFVL